MIKNIEKGKALIIKGPAKIMLLEGELEIFGKRILPEKGSSTRDTAADFEAKNILIVPGAQCYPLYAQENSKIDIYLNNDENLELIKENSISNKWVEIKIEVLKEVKNEKKK